MDGKAKTQDTPEMKIEKEINKDVKSMAELSGENKRIIIDSDGVAHEFCPVALKNLPKLIQFMNKLKDIEVMINEQPDEFIDIVAEIMCMGLRKSNLTKDDVKEKFTLESFQSVISYSTEVNGFFVPKKMNMG